MPMTAKEITHWNYVPVQKIQEMHRLTGACFEIKDGAIIDFFYEDKTEGEIANG